MSLQSSNDCAGRICGYGAFNGKLGCDSGPGSCWQALMLTAEESSFHDSVLQDATRRIGEILSEIPNDPDGRKLSFVHTKKGTILAWVMHGGTLPKEAVTIEHPHEDLMAALNIKEG